MTETMASNTTSSPEFDYLCRLCAAKTSVLMGLHIFEREGDARQIYKKITACLPVQVALNDKLPKMVCEECVYKLDLLFEFREKSIRTEKFLENMLETFESQLPPLRSLPLFPPLATVTSVSSAVQTMQTVSITVTQTIQDAEYTVAPPPPPPPPMPPPISVPPSAPVSVAETLPSTVSLAPSLVSVALPSVSLSLAPPLESIAHKSAPTSSSSTSAAPPPPSAPEIIVEMKVEQIKPNVKCEPEVLIKTEDSLSTVMNDKKVSDTETESDSDSDSDSDSYDNSVGNDPNVESAAAIAEHDVQQNQEASESDLLNTGITEASTSHEINHFDKLVSVEDGPIIEGGGNPMNPAANGLLMLSCPQPPEYQDQVSWLFCNICGKAFAKREEFQSHYEDHCNKCDDCGALFTNEEAMKAHYKEMHSQKQKIPGKPVSQHDKKGGTRRKKWEPKVCPECGKQYRTNYKLTEHMRKHTGEKPFKCSTCPKAFRSKIGLAQHEAKHTGQYEYTCSTCGKGFQCKSYLIVHQRVHSDLKPYPCSTCGRNFKTKQSLLDHQNRHLGVKPYLCETCGRRFITKGLCKSHQRVHSGTDNKQYPCTVCNKMFVSKSYLATHLRIHTGEKPFMCEVCGKGFLTRVDLRIHSTMHTGEKSFVCEWCGKAFARRDALRCHRRSHTGERPYRCDICGQSFTQFSPLTIHKRLHTGERPYPCDICEKAFVSRSTMMSHRRKHHTREMNREIQVADLRTIVDGACVLVTPSMCPTLQ